LNKERPPDGWEWENLDGVTLEYISGGTPSTKITTYWQGSIPWTRSANLTANYLKFGEKFISREAVAETATNVVPKNNVLVATRVGVGKATVNLIDVAISQDLTGLVLDVNRILPIYLVYYLHSPKIQRLFEQYSRGTTIQGIQRSDLSRIKIPLPPLDTQRKIVAILDKAEATQRLRAEADALMQDLIQSVFQEMFGDPATNPKQWDILTIGNVVEMTQYGSSQKSSERGGGYPCLGMNNLTYKGHFDLSHLKYVELSENEFRKYKLEVGDILFNRTNAPNLVGKTGVITKDTNCVFASYLIRLKVNTQIIVPEYLWAYLNSPFIKQTFTSMCKKAVNQANINATELQRVSIPIPPIDMQKVFAKSVRNLSGFKNITGESSKELLTLQNILMSKAFTGDLIA